MLRGMSVRAIFAVLLLPLVAGFAQGCAQSYSVSVNDAKKLLLTRSGTGSGNGEGFEGRVKAYFHYDSAQACAELDPSGAPLANDEIQVIERPSISTGLVARENCVKLDVPRPVAMSQLAPANDGTENIIFNGMTFVPGTAPAPQTESNLFDMSESIDNAYWDKINASVAGDAAAAPDASLTADLLRESTVNGAHEIARDFRGAVNVPYSCSVFVKASGRTRVALVLYENGAANQIKADANLASGTVATVASGTASASSVQIRSVGNGWYRVIAAGTLRTTASSSYPVCALYLGNATGSNQYAGDGSSGALVWGFTMEQASGASPYYSNTTKQAIGQP
jgi:hypothetical protein